jgi:hypothetical protein
MSADSLLNRHRFRTGGERPEPTVQYTAKDFQLEVLGKLAEMQSLTESLEESWNSKLEAIKEQRLLKFDSRTLIALGAIGLSITGYVIQGARNTARQDNEIETTKARVVRLELISAANTEGRIRMEVQLGELQSGQAEIKAMIEARDVGSKRAVPENRNKSH